MNTRELKQQAEKLIMEKSKYLNTPEVEDYFIRSLEVMIIIDSLIDKTVQMTEERVVGLIRKATTYDHSKCPIKETCIGYQSCVSDIENSVIASLITNKNNINKQ